MRAAGAVTVVSVSGMAAQRFLGRGGAAVLPRYGYSGATAISRCVNCRRSAFGAALAARSEAKVPIPTAVLALGPLAPVSVTRAYGAALRGKATCGRGQKRR